MVPLFKSVVRPVIEYDNAVWSLKMTVRLTRACKYVLLSTLLE